MTRTKTRTAQQSTMKQSLALRIVVSGLAILLSGVHLCKPELKIDSITIVLLVIAALPWVQPLIKSIELLGVKLELQALEGKVAEARGAAESAARQAGFALASRAGPMEASALRETVTADPDAFKSLAEEYNRIRRTQRSGDARTAAMTGVVRRMVDLAERVKSFDVTAALRESDRGIRLFAYAYLYGRPDSRMLLPLVESVTIREDKPFGQYWGLQSVGRVLAEAPQDGLPEVKAKLLAFSSRLPSGTDREFEVKNLLRQVEQTVGD